MNRTTFALVAAAISSLVPLGACGSLDKAATHRTPDGTAASATVAGTSATKPTSSSSPTMSMGEDHTPIPAYTNPVSAAQIYQLSRKAVFVVQGRLPGELGVRVVHQSRGDDLDVGFEHQRDPWNDLRHHVLVQV